MFQRPNLLSLFLKKVAVDIFCISYFPELSHSQVSTSKAASRTVHAPVGFISQYETLCHSRTGIGLLVPRIHHSLDCAQWR